MSTILPKKFFAQSGLTVAKALLGQRLIRQFNGELLSGLIVETEAYVGLQDTASHAHRGRTPRNEVMFGQPGLIYIYLIYGMYHMLNVITDPVDYPAAVLIRAIEPTVGLSLMHQHRQLKVDHTSTKVTNGPGKLCQALAIDKSLNQWDATLGQQLWFEQTQPVPDEQIKQGPRININSAAPADQVAPWRFWIKNNRFVSK